MQNVSKGGAQPFSSSQQLPLTPPLLHHHHHHHHLQCHSTRSIHKHHRPWRSLVPQYPAKTGGWKGNAHVASASASAGSKDGSGFDPRIPASENGFVKRCVMRARCLGSHKTSCADNQVLPVALCLRAVVPMKGYAFVFTFAPSIP